MVRFNEDKKANEIALVEIFKSLDGEGFHCGFPTVFVRTLGCNLRCAFGCNFDKINPKLSGFCDTPESLCYENYKMMYPDKEPDWKTSDELVTAIEDIEKDWTWKSICLTGGEPLVEENKEFMTEFIQKLVDLDYAVNIETNGAIDYKYWRDTFPVPAAGDLYGNRTGVSLITDWKLPSSKMNKLMKWDNVRGVLTPFDLIKCVVTDDPEDWKEVERLCKSVKNAMIYLSPCFGKVDLEKMWNWVADHPQYDRVRLQMQMHKSFFKNPDQKGV